MEYTIIRSVKQYKDYCKRIMDLASNGKRARKIEDEIELIQMLIDKWERENIQSNGDMDPVELIKYLMENHHLNQASMVVILGISKSSVSQILNYKKGLSKEIIRKLASHFKISQEALNRTYTLDIERDNSKNKKIISKVIAKI